MSAVPSLIPDCCNIGVIYFVLLSINGLFFSGVWLCNTDILLAMSEFIQAAPFLEVCCILSLLMLSGLRLFASVRQAPAWLQRIACGVVPAVVAAATFALFVSQNWILSDLVYEELVLIAAIAMVFGLFFQHYTELHNLAFSPAQKAEEFQVWQSYDTPATDYLLRPARAQRFGEELLRTVQLSKKIKSEESALTVQQQNIAKRAYFSVMVRKRMLRVPVSDVLYLKAEQKYVLLYTAQQHYLIEESLYAIGQEMPDVFVRIHRNTLVARSALLGVERSIGVAGQADFSSGAWHVILRGCKERLPISRRMWPEIKMLVS